MSDLTDGPGPLFAGTSAVLVGNHRCFTERQLQRPQPVTQRAGVVIAQFGGGRRHETGQRVDEHSCFGEVGLDVLEAEADQALLEAIRWEEEGDQ